MNPKSDLKRKHLYSYSCEGWKLKSEKKNVFIFLEIIELALSEFPKENAEEFIVIRDFLKSIYSLLWNRENFDSFLRATVFLEQKAEELEAKVKQTIKGFIDFSDIDDLRIKNLNKLRIYLRILESMFWNIINEIPDDARLLVIPHFLNVASKYVFYYAAQILKDAKFYSSKDILSKFIDLPVKDDLYQKYKQVYQGRLSEYLKTIKNE